MKLSRLLTVSTIALTLATIVTPPAHAACSDYATQEEARANYSRSLDRDFDGIACEDLPRRGTYRSPQQSRSTIPGWVYLTASDADSRINVRSAPSTSADSPHYGLVGERVWATRPTSSEGYTWYFVGFPGSGATGWVRGDLIAR